MLGEGAVSFVLEAAEPAARRRATVHAHLAGYGSAGDGHHWTEPHRGGQVRAMNAALDDAWLAPSDVGCINAQGTGTAVGDQVEAESIAAVFPSGPWISSTKATHGHLLGASGAIETAAAAARAAHAQPAAPFRRLPAAPGARRTGAACDVTRAARDAIFKACFVYALEQGAQWVVAAARRPLDRIYEGLMFEDVFEPECTFDLPYGPRVPHRVMALSVAQAGAKWIARAHPLLEFMLRTQPGDIDTGGANGASSVALQRHRVLPGVGAMAEALHKAAVVHVP